MGQGAGVDELLALAQAEFAGRLPAKVSDLERLLSSGAWQELRVASHKLRGSAATYGFAALGSLAADIEETLLAAACNPDATARGRLGFAVDQARDEAQRVASGRK
jgi:HPt (histidine-containing phosphotransfer) domain-containing protein